MTTDIQNSEGFKLITRDFTSDRNEAIAKAVLATAIIVMGVVATYFLATSATQLFTSMAPIVEINAAVVTATIACSVGAVITLSSIEMGALLLIKAVKDVVNSNKLLKALEDTKSSELKVICDTRKSKCQKQIIEIEAIRAKLISGKGSLEDLAYGKGCKFDNLDSNTREIRKKKQNYTAHVMLNEKRRNFSHAMGQMLIIISAAGAVAAVSLAIAGAVPLSQLGVSLTMPAVFTVIGGGLLFLPNKKWKQLTQLDQNKEYWAQQLEVEKKKFYSPISDEIFDESKTNQTAYEQLSGLLTSA